MLTDPNQRATTKKLGQYGNQYPLLKRKEQFEATQTNPGNKKTVAPRTLFRTTTIITTKTKQTVIEQNESQKLFIHSVRLVAKRTTPQRDVVLKPMQQKGHFP